MHTEPDYSTETSPPTSVWRSRLWPLFVICLTVSALAQEPAARILFLHLRLKDDKVTLIKTTVSPGTLKPIPYGGQDTLHVELADATGAILWTNLVADPSVQTLCAEDPARPGEMVRNEAFLDDVEFFVRAPVLSRSHHINFSRSHSIIRSNGPAGKVEHKRSAARQPLGTVALPEPAEKP